MKIKICGLTDPKEAAYLNAEQVDFAGMVLFFPKSKRNITIEQAKEIMAALDDSIRSVAVVVAPTAEQALQIQEAGFDYIQIHGALSAELAEQIQIPILKAFNISDLEQFAFYESLPQIAGYVFDAAEPGSGKAFDWSMLKELPRGERMFLLAGGLRAENVAEAIRFVELDGVDVSSGVEYTDRPGKDPEKIHAFVRAVREAEVF